MTAMFSQVQSTVDSNIKGEFFGQMQHHVLLNASFDANTRSLTC